MDVQATGDRGTGVKKNTRCTVGAISYEAITMSELFGALPVIVQELKDETHKFDEPTKIL